MGEGGGSPLAVRRTSSQGTSEAGRLTRRKLGGRRGSCRSRGWGSASAATATPATATPGHSSSHQSGARTGTRRPTRSTSAASARSYSFSLGGTKQDPLGPWFHREQTIMCDRENLFYVI